MLDKRPDPDQAHPTQPPVPVAAAATDGDEDYYQPTGTSEPLTGRAPAPKVKRFNRKAVAVLAGGAGLIAIAAFGTALTRKPPVSGPQEASAQKIAANTTATDAINALPSDYSQVKRSPAPALGAPIPGDIGAIAKASGAVTPANTPVYTAAPGAVPQRPLSPFEQYEQQQAMERIKREDQARQAGFSFENGKSGAAMPTAGLAGDLQKLLGSQQPGANGLSTAPGGTMPVVDRVSASRDDANRQDDKAQFINAERNNRFALKNGQMPAPSPYTLFSSTIIPGVLITGIKSDLPGLIKGQVSQDVYDTVTGQHLLLPQGTTIVGQYDSRVTYGQSRVLVVWTRLIRPDGSNFDLEGMPGVDLSGYAGLTGDVDRHIWRLLTAVVLGSVIQAGAQAGSSPSTLGEMTVADRARAGIGSGINDATTQIVRKELQIQPTITVAPGERFNVFLTKDLILTPYKL